MQDVEKQLLLPRIMQSPRLFGLPKIRKTNITLRPILNQTHVPMNWSNMCRLHYNLWQAQRSPLWETPGILLRFEKVPHSMRMRQWFVMTLRLFSPTYQYTSASMLSKPQENDIPVDIIMLLGHCINTNYFFCNGQDYFQIDGVAIGSPLAPNY